MRHIFDLDSSLSHTHKGYHQMIYVRRGTVLFNIEGHSYHVDRPSVIFIGCHEQHAVTVTGEVYERYMINVYPHKLGLHGNFRLFSIFSDRPESFCHVLEVQNKAAFEALLDLTLSEVSYHDNEFPDTPDRLLSGLLLLLYRESPDFFPRAESRRAETVSAIKQRIESSLIDLPSLGELGQEFHLSPYYLAHMFKDVTGYSIKNYHLLCRIAATRELLETTDISITDICEQVGFPDMSSLSRYFKREIGCTPSQYRKKNQKPNHTNTEERT
jgi:AraC-like DNA-binding protein